MTEHPSKRIEAVARALAWRWLDDDERGRWCEDAQALVDIKSVEDIARTLCKRNGNCYGARGEDLCPTLADCIDHQSFMDSATAVDEARAALGEEPSR